MTNKSILKTGAAAFSILLLFGISVNAQAFGLGSITGGGDDSSVDTSGLVKTSQRMERNFNLSISTINYAQSEAFKAFGMGEEAEEARLAAEEFKKGKGDKDDSGKTVAESNARDKILQEMSGKTVKMTGEARKHLAKSAAIYAGASYAGVRMAKDIVKWGSSAKDALSSLKKDPMKLASFTKDIEPGMNVLSMIPDLSSQWVSTSSKLIDYANINGDEIEAIKISIE